MLGQVPQLIEASAARRWQASSPRRARSKR